MTPQILAERLSLSAEAIGWQVTAETAFVSKRFRGRSDESSAPLPEEAIGLRLGSYPVIVAPVVLRDSMALEASLRRVHNQMLIARSHMRPEEVINAHIFLCAVSTEQGKDWEQLIDRAQRDETVCRKFVWMPDIAKLDVSYSEFVGRTFLALPWRNLDTILDADLDHTQGLAERTLTQHGLTAKAADQWVKLANEYRDDPDELVTRLVVAMEVRA